MNILTRGDFDGLTSGVLISLVEDLREIRFAHPKDCQDGKVPADEDDIVVNLPFIPGCGMWFDHHLTEKAAAAKAEGFNGRFEVAPSCARVIYNHFKSAHDKFEPFFGDA